MQLAACVAGRLQHCGAALLSSSSSSGSVLFLSARHAASAASLTCSSHQQQHPAPRPGQQARSSSSRSSYTTAAWHSYAPAASARAYNTSTALLDQQQQQQKGEVPTGGSNGDPQQQQQQQRPQSVNESAQEVSRAFLARTLDMEELWMSAVTGRLKVMSARKHTELKGKEAEVVDQLRSAYLDTLTRAAAGRLLSHRMRSQLKQACLAAATYKALLEVAPDDAKGAEQHIADAMGGLYAPFMLGGLKLSSWAKRLLLRQSSISQAVDTLHTLARDMEGACHVSVQPLSCSVDSDDDAELARQQQQQQQPGDGGSSSSSQAAEEDPAAAAEAAAREHHKQREWANGAALTVDSCVFAEVLQAEGVPQLLRYFCCQHNMSWLEAFKAQGVAASLDACIGKGDACCRMTVMPA